MRILTPPSKFFTILSKIYLEKLNLWFVARQIIADAEVLLNSFQEVVLALRHCNMVWMRNFLLGIEGYYNLWSMRMEQYLTYTDYALWEVIMNGDAPAVASASAEGPIPPKTAEQRLARKNELKAKNTLLLAIPDEHQLKFHEIKDAKSLWEAINTRFGGKKESKKM
ncbi:hypothetical protein Tco_0523897 [Tanacetum coccineum]